jgi:hypothetical protein
VSNYLVLKQTSLPGGDRAVRFVAPGEVLTHRDLGPHVASQIRAGEPRYATLFKEISDEEARAVGANLTAPEPRPAPDPGAVHPSELRWAGAAPGDEEHARELEARVSDLEAAFSGARGRRQRELIHAEESALPPDREN